MTLVQRRALLLAPIGAMAIGSGAWLLVQRSHEATYLQGISSTLIGKPLPHFSLPGLLPDRGLSSADVTASDRPAMINFFASWCIPCIQEAPALLTLKQQGMPIWGIAFRDKPDAVGQFLQQNANPYVLIGCDEAGNTEAEFGLYGVPETYLIDRSGIVRWRWAGGLSDDIVRQSLLPLLRTLA